MLCKLADLTIRTLEFGEAVSLQIISTVYFVPIVLVRSVQVGSLPKSQNSAKWGRPRQIWTRDSPIVATKRGNSFLGYTPISRLVPQFFSQVAVFRNPTNHPSPSLLLLLVTVERVVMGTSISARTSHVQSSRHCLCPGSVGFGHAANKLVLELMRVSSQFRWRWGDYVASLSCIDALWFF